MLAILAALTISPIFGSPPAQSQALETPKPGAKQEKGRILGDVFDLLDAKYVRGLDSDKLFQNSLKALLEGLDPHTQYFDPEEAKQFRQNLKNSFGGIGIIIKTDASHHPAVEARFLNAPAARAGIQKGDLIVEVDGQSTRGWTQDQVAGKLMGKVGTTVRVSVRRTGDEKQTFSIRRATIAMSSIRGLDPGENGQWLDKSAGIGYVRIVRFAEDTANGFRSAYSRLKKEGVRALVIDLRGNVGGLLSAAVKTADIFVDSGIIVRSVGRDGKEERWMARKGEDLTIPIAVLVDGETASSAEVLAACLQDHRRAIVVGVRTYGKGSIQQLFDVGKSGAMVKLTTAHYFPASGRNIDKLSRPAGSDMWGVSPDPGLEVNLDQAEREAWATAFFSRDGQVGTDLDVPPYASSSDKVLMAARDALKRAMASGAKVTIDGRCVRKPG
ncbi:MAG: hypothetical protein HONBIEJF_00427 [Fimbriimonadaceae bacterium]|nr:hypothetical protein [Fimbriimonadaceae bacterium]